MKIIEAIGKGFGIAGKNLGILMILFVFNAIWNLASLSFLGGAPAPANLKPTPQFFFLTLIFIFTNIFIQGGVFGVLRDALTSNERAALSNLAKYGKKFYLKFLGLGLVIITGIVLAVLIIGVIFSVSLAVKNIVVNIVVTILSIILSVVALYYLFLFFLSPYALVVDDVGIFKAMGNSMRFVKERFLKMLGLTTLLVLIGLGIGFIVGTLTGFSSFVLKGTAFQILTGIITSAVNAYVTIIISAALLAYYFAFSDTPQKKEAEAV